MKVETLDALAWATLTESATIARLANALVKDHSEWTFPTQTSFVEAIRSTKPPRGRAGPMLKLLGDEYRRQHGIFWKRKHAKDEWEQHLQNIANRDYRVQACYASAFGQPIYIGRRNNPYPWNHSWETRRAWDDAENKRPKGDNCVLLFIHQDCTVAVLTSVNDDAIPQLKVRRHGSGYTTTTLLRKPAYDAGELLVDLGGKAVTGALAHGLRVEIDYPGRRFRIHHADGDIHEAPWHIRVESGKREYEEVVVMGRTQISGSGAGRDED